MGQAQGDTALSLLQCHGGRRKGQCSALSAGRVFPLLPVDLILPNSDEPRSGCRTWRPVVIPVQLCQAVGLPAPLFSSPPYFILVLLFPGKDLIIHQDSQATHPELVPAWGQLLEPISSQLPLSCSQLAMSNHLSPGCGFAGAFAMIFANKKHFSTAIVGALITLSIIALVLSLVKIDDVTLPPTVKYGMVFDAGSSHTSLFVYEWDSDKENNTGVVSQALSCDVQGQGISSYANDPPKAGDSLRTCLEKALKVIPAAKQRDVPVYLGATAGMRLLRQKNSSAADQVLAEVAKTMQEYPVVFRGAQILTGEEEGAYGWITTNYLLESFAKFSPRARAWVHPEAANIYGALDLGGASTQISFMPESSVRNWSEASKFTLYGYNYNIYTHSYLCYGQNEMLKRLAKELIAESASSPRVDHPCYPRDYNETLSLSSFSTSPCTNHSDPRPGLSDRDVTLQGRGNASGCLAAIKKLFNFSACGQSQDCTFDGVSQPPIHGHFIAFSAFYYNFKFLNLTEGQSLGTVRETIEQFCTRSWEDLSSSYPEEHPERLPKYCANANYILTLLLDAYKFNQTSWNKIFFQMKVGSADVGWTLGYMLNLTNMIPAEAPAWLKGHVPSLWAAAITFIILTLALGITALLLLLWV